MNSLYGINLMPIEPLLFGDNRSARAGEDHLLMDQDPSPHTIYASIGAYLLKVISNNKRALIDGTDENWKKFEPYLGPFKSTIEDDDRERAELMGYGFKRFGPKLWFPRPQHFIVNSIGDQFFVGNSFCVNNISGLKSSCDFESLIDIKPHENEFDGECFVSEDLLEKILINHEIAGSVDNDVLRTDDIFQPEFRLGIKMDNQRNAIEQSMLFSRPYRRYKSDIDPTTQAWSSVSFYAWYRTKSPLQAGFLKNGIAFIGGDRGRAVLNISPETNTKPLAHICERVKEKIEDTAGFFAYLLTPAVREDEWPKIENITPVAAAIGKAKSMSGWNTDYQNQHPRPIMKLVPAGSTFFYKWPENDDNNKIEIIDKYWCEPISKKYKSSGFGRMLIGVWK